MHRKHHIITAALLSFLVCACTTGAGHLSEEECGWRLEARISDLNNPERIDSKVSYSGTYGERTQFETGDCFGLFVLDETGIAVTCNVKAYCSGTDNRGNSVWSVFKAGTSDAESSNQLLSEILSGGSRYFAYYPYKAELDTVTSAASLHSFVDASYYSIPSDQSASTVDCDLLVASNMEGMPYGQITVSGRSVTLTFAHLFAMLRFAVPAGAVKYDYLFGGEDFTPYLSASVDGMDIYRYIFNPGCILDICVKYVHNGKLYRFETGNRKDLWPLTTVAGNCYCLDPDAPKVPHHVAVDMGTSVMWAPFNMGAEDDLTATSQNIGTLKGNYWMWGVNCVSSSFGSSAYQKYNNSFTAATKPCDLPAGYDYSGDPAYDAARNLWKGEWRVPTFAEWEELYAACKVSVSDGIITFTSKTTGNSITLPFAGYNNGTPTTLHYGYYWSSTSNPDNVAKAKSTIFRDIGSLAGLNSNADRYTGLPVRPVYTAR